MDATTLLSCAGELSALLVSGGLLLAASVAAKQSRKRRREEDEHEPSAAREEGELSDGEEDSISVEWRQLRKLLKTNLQIDLVHRPDAGGDDKYVRLNFAAKLPAKPSADDENRLIKALSEAGIKVLGSEDAGVLCVSKSDVGFMSSEEVLRRLNVALSAYQVASAAAALAAANAPADAAATADDADDDADEEESVASASGRRRRVIAPKKAPASAAKRRRTTGDQSAL